MVRPGDSVQGAMNDEFGIDSEMGDWLKGEIDARPAAVPAMSR